MKILHIAETDKAGAGIAMLKYHKTLSDNGYDSKVLVLKKNSDIENLYEFSVNFFQKLIRYTAFEYLYYKLCIKFKKYIFKSKYELVSLPIGYKKLNRHPLVKEADVILLHWQTTFLDFKTFFEASKKLYIFILHDENHYYGIFHYDFDYDRVKNLWPINLKLENYKKNALKNINHIAIGNSLWTTNNAIRSKIFSGVKSYTLYYPFRLDKFNQTNKIDARRNLDISQAELYIGFSSDIITNERKGYERIVSIVNSLSKHKKIALILMGAHNEQFDGNCKLYNFGYIKDDEKKALIYSAMDIFLFPSKSEAFGQVAVEALLCGTPVSGADVGGIPEIIKNNINGYLFNSTTFIEDNIELLNQTGINKELEFLSKTTRDSVTSLISETNFLFKFKDILMENKVS